MTPYEVGFEDGISGRNHRRPEGFDGAALTEYAHGYNAGEASYMSSVPEIVQAPSTVSTLPSTFDGTHSWVTTGAWASRLLGRKVWQTMFAGTHQRVPFHTVGRTPGRSLRAMRRALERAALPVVGATCEICGCHLPAQRLHDCHCDEICWRIWQNELESTHP